MRNWKKREAEKNGVPPGDTQRPEAVRRPRQREAARAGAAGEAEGHDSRERSALCQGRLCAGPLSLNFSLEECTANRLLTHGVIQAAVTFKTELSGARVAQLAKHLPLARGMISWPRDRVPTPDLLLSTESASLLPRALYLFSLSLSLNE